MWSHFTCSNAGWWHGGYLSYSFTDRWLLLTVLFVGFWRDSFIDRMVAWLLVPPFELTGHLSQWIFPSLRGIEWEWPRFCLGVMYAWCICGQWIWSDNAAMPWRATCPPATPDVHVLVEPWRSNTSCVWLWIISSSVACFWTWNDSLWRHMRRPCACLISVFWFRVCMYSYVCCVLPSEA